MSEDELVCGRCGNYTILDGFEPCDEAGNLREPTPGWPGLYRCEFCHLVGTPEDIAAGRDSRLGGVKAQ